MEEKSEELMKEIICGLSTSFDYEKPKKLKRDKNKRIKLHPPSQGSSLQEEMKGHGKEIVIWSMQDTGLLEKTGELEVEIICGLPCRSKIENTLLNWRPNGLRARRSRRKYLSMSRILTKGHFGGDSKPKRLFDYNLVKVYKMVRAWNAQLESNLQNPVFMKVMLRSHASVGFSLGIPAHFCRRYLPLEDTLMTLETVCGEQYETKYLLRKNDLSGGWRRFAIDQKLVEGDRVVFQLVEATKFKVYIIRKGFSPVNLPTPLLKLYTTATQSVSDNKSLLVYKRRDALQLVENSIIERWDDSFRNFDASKLDEVEAFNNVTNKLLRNQELPETTLQAYFKLCRTQNAFLHAHLLIGLNIRFFAGAIQSIISQTVSFASALGNCRLSTFLDNYSEWDRSLNSCEALGMNVSLLRARLHHLRDVALRSEGAANRSRYIEACRERQVAGFEVKKLEMVLAKLRKASIIIAAEVKALESKAGWGKYLEAYSRLLQAKDEIIEVEVLVTDFEKFFEHYDAVIETLKTKASDHEHQFQVEVGAPW